MAEATIHAQLSAKHRAGNLTTLETSFSQRRSFASDRFSGFKIEPESRPGWTFADVAPRGSIRYREPGPKTSSPRRKPSYDEPGKTMALDWQVCSQARLSRDARFDG